VPKDVGGTSTEQLDGANAAGELLDALEVEDRESFVDQDGYKAFRDKKTGSVYYESENEESSAPGADKGDEEAPQNGLVEGN
jgi:hypothetical protein